MSQLARLAPEDFGALRDHFGLLTKDHQELRSEAFKKFLAPAFPVTEIAKELGVSRTALYTKKLKISKEFMRTKVIPIIQAADLAFLLFKNDDATRRWILSPNSYFFGKSPLEVCLFGDGAILIEFLSRKLGLSHEEKKAQ